METIKVLNKYFEENNETVCSLTGSSFFDLDILFLKIGLPTKKMEKEFIKEFKEGKRVPLLVCFNRMFTLDGKSIGITSVDIYEIMREMLVESKKFATQHHINTEFDRIYSDSRKYKEVGMFKEFKILLSLDMLASLIDVVIKRIFKEEEYVITNKNNELKLIKVGD